MKKPRIPVIMYHSIGVPESKWHWNYLTCPYQVFEEQLKTLKKNGYNTIIFQDIYDYIMKGKTLPKKSIFLTFDDGYLDNYVFAYPLLKKYGMKGTIFVNPDFVDNSEAKRQTFNPGVLDFDVNNLNKIGFCNWSELKEMDEQGVIDVQSHAKTHTWYPISDKIIDFRHPGDDYIWMDWNENEKEKPNLQIFNQSIIKYGMPIFEHEKSLSSKRVFVNNDFSEKIHQYAIKKGNNFFKQNDWKKELFRYAEDLKKSMNIIEHREDQKEYENRIRYELEYTKKIIEDKLDKKVNFLCWPGGSGTKEGVRIAEELGYLMSTAARDLSTQERKAIKNSPDYKINRISRITPVMINKWEWHKKDSYIKYSSGWYFLMQIWHFRRVNLAHFWFRFLVKINYKLELF